MVLGISPLFDSKASKSLANSKGMQTVMFLQQPCMLMCFLFLLIFAFANW